MKNLQPEQLLILQNILRQYVPDRRVFVFGSRATDTAKPFSDIDLMIMGDEPVPLGIMGTLRESLSASDLPFRVDLVDWASTNQSFRQSALRNGIEISSGTGQP